MERGFSLFEVLITVVVVSIGLLGLAGLQFAGLRAANRAQEHTYANLLAQDIEERIRANQASGYLPFTQIDTVSAAPTAIDCTTNDCNADEMRDFDRRRWYYMINSGGDINLDNTPILPKATINVANAGITYTITISWGNPAQTLTANFSL